MSAPSSASGMAAAGRPCPMAPDKVPHPLCDDACFHCCSAEAASHREAVEPGLREALEFIETYKAPWGAAKSEFWEDHGFSRGGSPDLRALGIIEAKLRALLTDAPARQRASEGMDAETLYWALKLAKDMIVANGLDIPHTMEVIDAALSPARQRAEEGVALRTTADERAAWAESWAAHKAIDFICDENDLIRLVADANFAARLINSPERADGNGARREMGPASTLIEGSPK
jgi:hypothetical protein